MWQSDGFPLDDFGQLSAIWIGATLSPLHCVQRATFCGFVGSVWSWATLALFRNLVMMLGGLLSVDEGHVLWPLLLDSTWELGFGQRCSLRDLGCGYAYWIGFIPSWIWRALLWRASEKDGACWQWPPLSIKAVFFGWKYHGPCFFKGDVWSIIYNRIYLVCFLLFSNTNPLRDPLGQLEIGSNHFSTAMFVAMEKVTPFPNIAIIGIGVQACNIQLPIISWDILVFKSFPTLVPGVTHHRTGYIPIKSWLFFMAFGYLLDSLIASSQ